MNGRRKRLIIRWSALAMALTALFWGVWSLFAPVPEVTKLLVNTETENVLTLPFAVSRWWDVLFAGMWSSAVIWLVTHPRMRPGPDDEAVIGSLSVALSVALGVGLVGSLGVGLVGSLAFGLDVGLGVGLGVALGGGLGVGLIDGLAFGLGVGLGGGLGVGLVGGLVGSLAFGLVGGLGVGLGVGLTKLCVSVVPAMRAIWNWLCAKPREHIPCEPNAVVAEYDRIVRDLSGLAEEASSIAAKREWLLARQRELLSPGSESAKVIDLRAERHAG